MALFEGFGGIGDDDGFAGEVRRHFRKQRGGNRAGLQWLGENDAIGRGK